MKPRVFKPDIVRGKRVLVRVDFNVPIDNGVVRDDTRIRESLPTILELLSAGAYPTLISHLGRPKGKPDPAYSLAPIVPVLRELLKANSPAFKLVKFVGSTAGDEVAKAVSEQSSGEVLLLENTRFHPGEEANDEGFAKELASPFEVFVNDAFASLHRAHASTEGVTRFLPSYAGFLVEKEVLAFSRLMTSPERPYVVIIGGKKVSDKLPILKGLMGKVDIALVGGAIANTFARATGVSVGASFVEEEVLSEARAIVDEFRRSTSTLVLPLDFTVTDDIKEVNFLASRRLYEIGEREVCADIGEESRALFAQHIRQASTIFWNGPMGAFEYPPFDEGSYAIAKAIAGNESAFKVAGGGETIEFIESRGFGKSFSHISTGGGASLELISGATLPGLAPLLEE